jgi:transposase
MAQGKPRDMRKERQWRHWILRWQQSSMSVRAFCVRHDLSQPSFYAWRREIQQRDAAANTFMPVRVLPDRVPDQQRPRTDALEVVLADGRRLRVSPGFDPATLRHLLAILEEVPTC